MRLPWGSECFPVTSWSELGTVMQNEGGDVYISGDEEGNIIADSILTIDKKRTIIATKKVTITRDANLSESMFTLNADLIMKGSEGKQIILDGNNVVGQNAMINTSTKNITLEYVTMQNCINSNTDGAAIYVNNTNTSTATTLTLKNCTFNNNKVNNLLMAGGAVGVGANNSAFVDVIITNCTFENNTSAANGGALYIYSSGASQINNCTFKNNLCASSQKGGAIYLYQGRCTFDNLTMENNGYKDDEYNLVETDVYAYSPQTIELILKNKIKIPCYEIRFITESTPIVKLDSSFSTESKIKFICESDTDGVIGNGKQMITLDENQTLSNEQINCFEIIDSEEFRYGLGTDGKLISLSVEE